MDLLPQLQSHLPADRAVFTSSPALESSPENITTPSLSLCCEENLFLSDLEVSYRVLTSRSTSVWQALDPQTGSE